jgi:hypothetical protein
MFTVSALLVYLGVGGAALVFLYLVYQICIHVVRIYDHVVRICTATEKATQIAEKDAKDREDHRCKTMEEREKERREKKLAAAIKVVKEIQRLLKNEGVNLQVHVYQVVPDQRGVFDFGGHVYDKKGPELRLQIIPGPVDSVVVNRYGSDGFQGFSSFVLPDDQEGIVKVIVGWYR